jgi:hypothetical protein
MPTTKRTVTKKVARSPKPPTGRPRKYDEERKQFQTRFPLSLAERLEREADRRHISKTLVIEQLVAEGLPRWEKQKISAA